MSLVSRRESVIPEITVDDYSSPANPLPANARPGFFGTNGQERAENEDYAEKATTDEDEPVSSSSCSPLMRSVRSLSRSLPNLRAPLPHHPIVNAAIYTLTGGIMRMDLGAGADRPRLLLPEPGANKMMADFLSPPDTGRKHKNRRYSKESRELKIDGSAYSKSKIQKKASRKHKLQKMLARDSASPRHGLSQMHLPDLGFKAWLSSARHRKQRRVRHLSSVASSGIVIGSQNQERTEVYFS